MKLVHYSAEPLDSLALIPMSKWGARNGFSRDPFIGDKPIGLWVSDDDAETNWKTWCEGEEWNLKGLSYATEIHLIDDPQLLFLNSEQDIRDFTFQYGVETDHRTRLEINLINWRPIIDQYSGIIITPYQWNCRLDPSTFWYYSWDCASGCIWDISIVKELRPIRSVEKGMLIAPGLSGIP